MNVFFSGTDWAELNDNCPNHNFYLSLIVNNFMEMEAKIAFTATPKLYSCLDEEGKEYEMNLKADSIKPLMLVYDCQVVLPGEGIKVTDTFEERLQTIQEKSFKKQQAKQAKEQAEAAAKKAAQPQGRTPGFGNWNDAPINQPVTQPFRYPGPTPLTSEKKEQARLPREFSELEGWDFDGGSSVDELVEITSEEQFACFLLRMGNRYEDDSLEDVLEDIDQAGLNGDSLRKSIVSDYGIHYANFFEGEKAFKSDKAFSEVLEQVVIMLFQYETEYAFLGSVVEGLRELEQKFTNYVKEDNEGGL
jgi:hypothetical protein